MTQFEERFEAWPCSLTVWDWLNEYCGSWKFKLGGVLGTCPNTMGPFPLQWNNIPCLSGILLRCAVCGALKCPVLVCNLRMHFIRVYCNYNLMFSRLFDSLKVVERDSASTNKTRIRQRPGKQHFPFHEKNNKSNNARAFYDHIESKITFLVKRL